MRAKRVDRKAFVVTRILGARQLVHALLSGSRNGHGAKALVHERLTTAPVGH
ncbi:MAG: hypothetical protein WAN71_28350 [Mycobacterium sp.]|uniref:hypothetical protein n=1 Tax=Mycobacterium sp. TaxID=1785 RepID=UPI003BB06655